MDNGLDRSLLQKLTKSAQNIMQLYFFSICRAYSVGRKETNDANCSLTNVTENHIIKGCSNSRVTKSRFTPKLYVPQLVKQHDIKQHDVMQHDNKDVSLSSNMMYKDLFRSIDHVSINMHDVNQ